ncbi:tetratricopeptide repeat protein [Desulfatiferula olefinivorans]
MRHAVKNRLDEGRAESVMPLFSVADTNRSVVLYTVMKKKKSHEGKTVGGQKRRDLDQALALHRQGRYDDAVAAYERLAANAPNQSDYLYLWALALYQSGNPGKAAERCRAAISVGDDSPDCHNLLGQIHLENRNYKEAAACFRKVLSLSPSARGVQNTLGLALQGLKDYDHAESCFLKEIEINPADPHPYNNLGLLCRDRGDCARAVSYFEKALSLDPRFYLTMNNMGQVLLSEGRAREALSYFERALSIEPECAEARLNLSIALWRTGKPDEAFYHGNRAKERHPACIDIHKHLVNVCLGRGDFETAETVIDEAMAIDPENADLFLLKGLVHHEKGDFEEASKYYNRCLSINPEHPGAFNNSGNIFRAMNLFVDAEFCYLKAIEYCPGYAEAYSNLGLLYMELNDLDNALECYDKAIDLHLENPNVFLNKGTLYKKMGDAEKAAEQYHRALELNPNLPHAYYYLGETARESGDYQTAISYYEKALERNPDYGAACDQLAYVLQRVCDWDKARIRIDQVMALTQKALETGSDVDETAHHSLSLSDDPERAFRVARAWSTAIEKRVSTFARSYSHLRHPRETITIGYFSNTFRNHPGGHLIAGLFEYHNRERFRVICYSYGQDDRSYFRKKAEEGCDLFRDVRGLDDRSAADLIHTDGVDILVDLRGQTAGHRMGVCAMRPSPVQVVYLGFPGSSGADFFDYLIADSTVVPDEHRPYFSEHIVFMPDCYQVTNRSQPVSDELFLRKDLGLPEQGCVFCSFNTSYKIDSVMFDCWMDILKQVPESVLWLLKDSDCLVENLCREAEVRGVRSNRLVFAEHMSKERHLKRIRLADLALDTRIYTGHTTTSDSLWAGVPVISMIGNHFASRVSASILRAAGLPELVVPDRGSYVSLAVELARNREALHRLRQKVWTQRTRSALFDTARFAQNIEKAYTVMWNRFVEGRSPDTIVIEGEGAIEG